MGSRYDRDRICFTHCTVTAAAELKAGSRRRQVIVQGRRVKTIDVHAHCVIPAAAALAKNRAGREERFPGLVGRIPERLAAMDEQGIDMEALSINPFWYREERDSAARIVEIQNTSLAELCASYPDRFVAFASVALQYPDLAAQQLEHAIKKLGLRGAAVGASVGDEEFSHPRFHPFWAKAQELGALVFIHPASTPELARRFKGNGKLSNVIGNPLDTTIALSHLIFDGTLDRFPGLKICAAHGGGYLPSYAPRSDAARDVFPECYDEKIGPRRQPTEYLRELYFDSLVFTAEALRHLVAQVGAGQIVMGTDYPIPWQPAAVDHILNTPTLSDDERAAILGGTAAKLLGFS